MFSSIRMFPRVYYCAQNGSAYGPHTLVELRSHVASGKLDAEVLVAASGDSDWVPLRTLLGAGTNTIERSSSPGQKVSSDSRKSVFSFLDGITGLPPAKALPWREIAKKCLATNSEGDAETILLSGRNQVAMPWVFSRILIGGLVAVVSLYWALSWSANPKLIPGFFFAGCVTVPMATLVLILELCTASQLNGFRVAKSVVLGGLLSILFTIFLNALPVVSSFTFTPMMAGPVEETAKLLSVIYVARNWSKARCVQDGIILGAAVGAGFAMIETAGYIFESYVIIHGDGVLLDWYGAIGVLAIRGVVSPFAHVLWTAVVAGAFWYGSLGKSSKWNGALSSVFLRIFIFIVGLHAFWNSPFLLPFEDQLSAIVGKYLLIGLSGWYVLLQLRGSDKLTNSTL